MVEGRKLSQGFLEELHYGTLTPARRDKMERIVMCLLAGPLAEQQFTRRRNTLGASSDYRQVTDFIFSTTGSLREAQAYIDWLVARTEQMVSLPPIWACVEELAEALLREPTLSAKAVRGIYESTK
jgi:hypothetical protein